MIEKEIRSGICQAAHRYAKANNTYLKNYDKKFDSSYIEYLDGNKLYGWAMSQKQKNLSKFNEDSIKKYDEDSNTGYFLEVDIEYSKTLFNSHKYLPFLPEIKKVGKVEKLICVIENKGQHVIHVRALKQSLNHRLNLKKVHSNSV